MRVVSDDAVEHHNDSCVGAMLAQCCEGIVRLQKMVVLAIPSSRQSELFAD